MSEAMPTCGQCRYFRTETAAPEAPPPGLCRRRSPGGKGWPGTKASEWCGEWVSRDQARIRSPMDLVLSKVDRILDRLQELDERVTAMELSVTAAHLEFRQKDA